MILFDQLFMLVGVIYFTYRLVDLLVKIDHGFRRRRRRRKTAV